MNIISPDLITTLDTDREEILKLIAPYADKLLAGTHLTPEEEYRYISLCQTYHAISNDLDAAWKSMVTTKKPSLIQRIFNKH